MSSPPSPPAQHGTAQGTEQGAGRRKPERPRKRRGFDARRYARTQEVRLVVGFFVLLYLVGGALIWWFYGRAAALLGLGCISGGLLFFLLVYAMVTLIGWWANRVLEE